MMKKVAPVSCWAVMHQVVEIGDPDRVEAGVGLVEQDDLGVGDHRPGQAGPLLIPPDTSPGSFFRWSKRPTSSALLQHDLPDFPLALAGVLAQGEGDVVVEAHRSEQRTVLKEHAELPPDLIEPLLAQADHLRRRPPRSRLLRVCKRPRMFLSKHRLARPRRAEDGGDLALGNIEGDVLEHRIGAEALGHAANGDDRLTRADPRTNPAVGGPARLSLRNRCHPVPPFAGGPSDQRSHRARGVSCHRGAPGSAR